MFSQIIEWWEKNGFTLIVSASILFFIVCWIMGWKPRKGRAGSLSDYVGDIFNAKPKKKRNTNKTENKCREIVEDIFQAPFPSVRPDFLKNPETGRNLECDMMNEDLKLCIERNGEQHDKHVTYFHTEEQFSKQKERDALKAKLLSDNGYTLVSIPYIIHYDILDKYIPYKLSKIPKFKPYVDRFNKNNN